MSDVRIIVCVLCCFSLIECQTVSILQDTTDWFTAFQTCKMLNGRLPDVNISNDQLELQDLSVTKNISSPFWIGATYDFLNINDVWLHYEYKYPYTSCERIWNIGGTHMVESTDCLQYNTFLCVSSTNTISANQPTDSYLQWKNAFQACKERNQRLPKRDNAQFLAKVMPHVGIFWLDGIKQINFKPDIGIQNRNCLHSLIGIIHEGNCNNTSMTTVCIFDNNTSGSEPNTDIPSIKTESPSKAGSSHTETTEAKYTKSTSKPTETMQFQMITNGTITKSISMHVTYANSTNMTTIQEIVINNKFLFWGIVAALSVLLTVSTIIIITLVIKLRQARRQNANTKKKEDIAMQQDVDSYQTLDHRNRDSRNGYDTLIHITPPKDERI